MSPLPAAGRVAVTVEVQRGLGVHGRAGGERERDRATAPLRIGHERVELHRRRVKRRDPPGGERERHVGAVRPDAEDAELRHDLLRVVGVAAGSRGEQEHCQKEKNAHQNSAFTPTIGMIGSPCKKRWSVKS